MTTAKQEILFAGLPRRRPLAGVVTIGLWLGLGIAFVTDAVPTRSSIDWLYGVEARRDAHARVLAARAAAKEAPIVRHAARPAPPAERARPERGLVQAALPSSFPAPVEKP